MEEIFKQSFTYAKIKLFKNYSTLSNKLVVFDSDPISSGLPINGSIPNDDPFGELPEEPHPRKFVVSANANDKSCQSLYNLNLYKKNNRNYFFTTNPTDSFVNHAKRGTPTVHCDVVKLVNVKQITSEGYRPDFFETTKDGQIKRHYNNPFASIEINKVERWIQRDGNKIKVKLFRQTKTRKLGSKYYTRNTSSTTVIFDTVKGNFLIVTYQVQKKKKIKKFYSNSFLSLERAIPDIFNVKEHSLSGMSPLHPVFKGIFNNADFQEKLMFTMGLENNISDLKYEVMGRNFVKEYIPRFSSLKKIKVPNDSYRLIRLFYPTEKYLKKNDRKLVAAILDRFGVLSKFTVKLLHEHSKMEFHQLLRLCHLFDKDYAKFLGSINPSFYEKARDNHLYGEEQSARHLLMDGVMMLPVGASDNEKENMVHIINDMCTTHSTPVSGVVNQFYDHFRMLERLRNYYPELGLNSRKWHTFTTEHTRLSAMERNIKKGYSVHNIFEKYIIEEIEKPIEIEVYPVTFKSDRFEDLANFNVEMDEYSPKLLRTSEDYVDEGAYMHHCVAGYIESRRSIIVSLRHGTERVTCEFSTRDKKCLQARYTQNQTPPKHFDKPLEMLKERIKRIPFSIEPIDRQMIPLKINGVAVKVPDDEMVGLPEIF